MNLLNLFSYLTNFVQLSLLNIEAIRAVQNAICMYKFEYLSDETGNKWVEIKKLQFIWCTNKLFAFQEITVLSVYLCSSKKLQ